MKKTIYIFIIFIFSFFVFLDNDICFSEKTITPEVNCYGLPGCTDKKRDKPGLPGNVSEKFNGISFIARIIGQLIKYVSVISVIAIMISGIMYIVSIGEEEKAKKAKKWIIWSLVGVFLSFSAWSIINLLNTFKIN